MSASLFDAMVRHSIYVEGLKRSRATSLQLAMLKLNTQIKAELSNVSYSNLGDMNKAQVAILLGKLKALADGVFNAWLNELIEWLQRYIAVDRELLPRIFAATSASVEEPAFEKARDPAGIWSLARNTAIGANGVLLLPFLRGFTAGGTARILQVTQMGVVNRATPAELAEALAGKPTVGDRKPPEEPKRPSPLQAPAGGITSLLNRQGAAVSNTVLQHVAAQTSMTTAAAAFLQYLWVSVLDDATTNICRSRNGIVYRYGVGPMPPAHINCRSSTVPFDGTAPATMPTFRMWAAGQMREFVNDAFDAEPGSTYDGARALSLEQFAGKFALITG